MHISRCIWAFVFLSSFPLFSSIIDAKKSISVVYDGRSLIIDGSRQLLFSGSIHYTRSPPEMWPDLIRKAKQGGLNVIETYVFWNVHEPVQGQWNFEGKYDLVKFLKLIHDSGLYVVLRVGPFIEAEWNHGGLPYWLREVPDIIFRSDNEPFKYHMKKYTEKIISMMKNESLFAPQGGPIILTQIENEYNNVQLAYREKGLNYIQWAGNMALDLKTGVPWIMCKQRDAPGPIINTCNGRQCGDTFTGPNSPNKPSLWTENWTAQYRVFGDPPSQRSAEDIAYSVARFFSKNGTLTNYYMYHGGTNFGRTTSTFVTTRYYDEAPLDEFGLKREPKFGHLRDLHRALKLSKKALLWGTTHAQMISQDIEIRTYEKAGTSICAAFINNNNTKISATVNFRGRKYFLPPRSISILPDCKTVVYNTQTIVAQHSSRKFHQSKKASNLKWEMHQESVPEIDDLKIKNKMPLELYNTTKDTSDYLWYSTSIEVDDSDMPMRNDIHPVIQVANLGHAMVAFVNGEYIGFGHGSNVEKSFVFNKPINLKPGKNHISLLASTTGLPDAGAYMEKRYAGVRAVTIQGLNFGTVDITPNNWGHEVGVKGENQHIYKEHRINKVQWSQVKGTEQQPITWYKTYFESPEGNNPVAVRMTSMGKGMIWVNGISIGRYWVNYLSPIGQPSQSEYHIPRAFLKKEEGKKNLMVVFEEVGGNPDGIEIQIVNRDTICSYITENHPPSVHSWTNKAGLVQTKVDDLKTGAHLTCPGNKIIKHVEFASFGDPSGSCEKYVYGNCTSPNSLKVVEQYCLGKKKCSIPLDRGIFDNKNNDKCPGIGKVLAVQVRCGHDKSSN
ncbi:beta-galactosidase 13-like [Impatiens glandulifera]|uniref:beta-galactosidase 13-like n=1 Tax=Impatiens glandulifera TaxID=253017 RepID=UPI001FB0D2C7|nr:beta-galactosidase 13-like [Impatiens glandulifera]